MITIYDLTRGLSRQVSHSLLARGLQLSFYSDQSHPSQWLNLLANLSDAPHVKSHRRKMLIFFTPSCRGKGKILNSQMKNSFSRRSPSSVRPRRKRARLLPIVLLQPPPTLFDLPAHAIWNTNKKRTVDWPHEFAPGNFSSFDYDKLELPDFVGGFFYL